MNQFSLLFVSGLLLIGAAACQKDSSADEPSGSASGDEHLAGEMVNVGVNASSAKKLFVLNEGGMGSNNATLDFLDLRTGKYVRDAYGKMNPEIPQGLGDVGNDIAVWGDALWIVVNNSGIVEVVNPENERHIATVAVPMPRNIAFDGIYAYVSSWNGAVAVYGADWAVDPDKSKNPKGAVYKIDTRTYQVVAQVEVGYQPEGLAVSDGMLYVANSGGIASSLPPTYSYDNTLSVIDLETFTVTDTIEIAPNPKGVYAAPNGDIFVTILGNYYDVHSGMYLVRDGALVRRIEEGTDIGCNVSVSAMEADGFFWAIGNDTELDWSVTTHDWYFWGFNSLTGDTVVWRPDFSFTGKVPYGLFVDNSDIYIADAGDYFNPGTLSLYQGVSFQKSWTVTAGVCPAHFALWK